MNENRLKNVFVGVWVSNTLEKKITHIFLWHKK